jgi:hypothetical protein
MRGGFVAYAAIVRKLSERFPGMEPLPDSRILRTTRITPGMDMAKMLGLSRHFREEFLDATVHEAHAKRVDERVEFTESQVIGQFKPIVFENTNRDLPQAIVIGDSYSFRLIPFLAENFRRLVFLPEHVLDPLVIEREKPDVVIHEMVERKLYFIPPDDPVCQPGYTGIPRLATGQERESR